MAADCTARRKPRELTERQRAFARLIHSQIPPHRAWPMAGFSSNRGNCYRALKENERLRTYLGELERRALSKHDITLDRILTQLQDAIELATKQNNPSPIIAAAMAQAKLCGFLVDRREIKQTDAIESMDREQVVAVLREQIGDNAEIVLTVLGMIPSPNASDGAN